MRLRAVPAGAVAAAVRAASLQSELERGRWAHLRGCDGSTTDSVRPNSVFGLSRVKAIAAGYNHTCALDSDGSLWCWGWNAAGQLADGSQHDRATPVRVLGLEDVQVVAGGGFHTCAARDDGEVFCWGSNDSGQLGDGTRADHFSPIAVPGFPGTAPLQGETKR